MSYNGSGTFQINSSGQPVVTGTVISSTAFNALTADLATGLSTAITKDGQTTTTSRILFAQGISSTLVTDATSATTGSIITAGGISTQKALWVGTTSTFAGTITAAAANFSGNVTTTSNGGFSVTASAATKAFFGLFSTAGAANYIGAELRADETSGLQFFQTSSTYNTAASTLLLPANVASSGQVWNNRGTLILGAANGPIDFYTNSQTTIAARFDTSGNLLVNCTSTGVAVDGARLMASNLIQISRTNADALSVNLNGSNGACASFYKAGVAVGNISVTGSATAYNTSSDQRLKTNIIDASEATADLLAVKVRSFDWKSDDSHQRYGMVAQELLEIAPDAVHVPADPDQMMGVDYSKLVPMMIKAIQELTTRLAALETK